MRNYKTRIPGVDRASEAKNPGGRLKSSALQNVGDPQGKIMTEPAKYRKAPSNFMPKPGTSSKKFGITGALGAGINLLKGGDMKSAGKKFLTGGLFKKSNKKSKY
jgi:hypothetical protein